MERQRASWLASWRADAARRRTTQPECSRHECLGGDGGGGGRRREEPCTARPPRTPDSDCASDV